MGLSTRNLKFSKLQTELWTSCLRHPSLSKCHHHLTQWHVPKHSESFLILFHIHPLHIIYHQALLTSSPKCIQNTHVLFLLPGYHSSLSPQNNSHSLLCVTVHLLWLIFHPNVTTDPRPSQTHLEPFSLFLTFICAHYAPVILCFLFLDYPSSLQPRGLCTQYSFCSYPFSSRFLHTLLFLLWTWKSFLEHSNLLPT